MNMNADVEKKVKRIKRTSVVLRAVCTGLLVFTGVVAVFALIAMLAGRVTRIGDHSQSFVIADLALRSRVILLAICLAAMGVILKALFHLRRLFDNYSRQEIFTAGSARQIRQFGYSCILWGVIKAVWAFLPLILSTNPPLSYAITGDPIIIGVVIIGISWFAEMATNLREENELTI